MKKFVSSVMTAVLCSSFVCGNSSDTGKSVRIVDLFMDNYDVWSESALFSDNISVSFLDIDFDGEPELTTKISGGSGMFTYLKFYKIVDDKISEMNISGLRNFPDSELKLYYNKNTHIMEYFGNNTYKSGIMYNSDTFSSFAYHDSVDAIVSTEYFSRIYENKDIEIYSPTLKYYDCQKNTEITEEE